MPTPAAPPPHAPRARRGLPRFAPAALAALALLAGVGARDARAQTTRTVTVSITGQGTVTSTPAGINCTSGSGTCSAALPTTGVTLAATPAAGWTFVAWTGACTGSAGCSLPASFLTQSVGAVFGPTITVVGGGTGSGTVTSSPAGIACVITNGIATGTCTAGFPSGTLVTLLQSPSAGSASAGCTPACAMSLTTATTVTVSFSGNASGGGGTVAVNGAGTGTGTIASTPGGIACVVTAGLAGGVGCSASFPPGTSVTLTASAASGSTFTGWSGACSTFGAMCTLTVGSAGVLNTTANFQAQATGVQVLTVAGAGSGSGTVTSTPTGIVCNIVRGVAITDGPVVPGVPAGGCAAGFNAGAVVNLVATPADDGSRFGGWSGPCTATGFVCRIMIDQAATVTATFTRNVSLTVTGTGTGTGTVTSTPAGISCTITTGNPGATGCTGDFAPGTVVTLSAAPAGAGAAGGPSTFTGWSGACSGVGTCTVTVSQATSVRASFSAAPPLVVRSAGTGSGRVTSAPAGINCAIEAGVALPNTLGSTCRATYPAGTAVILTATPAAGNIFLGWGGVACAPNPPGTNPTGSAAVCTVSLSDSVGAAVSFAALPAPATAATDLLTGGGLTDADRAVLDQLGNRDGQYNLGDLLALLDRTGQQLGSDVLARLLALPADLGRPLRGAPSAPSAPRRP